MEGLSRDMALGMVFGGLFTLTTLCLLILLIGKALRKKDFRCQGRKNG